MVGLRHLPLAMDGGLIEIAGYAKQEFPSGFQRTYFASVIEAGRGPSPQ